MPKSNTQSKYRVVLSGSVMMVLVLTTAPRFAEEIETSTLEVDKDEKAVTKPFDFAECVDQLRTAIFGTDEDEEWDAASTLEASIARFNECLDRVELSSSSAGESAGLPSGQAGITPEGDSSSDSSSDSEGTESPEGQESTVPMPDSNNIVRDPLESGLNEMDQLLAQESREITVQREAREVYEAETAAKQMKDAQVKKEEASEATNHSMQELDPNDIPPDENKQTADAKHENTTRKPLDSSEEDMVLKALREAAELEPDPETKQALWDQYYDYADQQ